jgi:hypothetical protein
MSGGQVAALIFAILLLLPGGCFLVFGLGFAADSDGFGLLLLLVAAVILVPTGLLFRFALRRRAGSSGSSSGTPGA